MHEIDI